jgi:hypothetical protein
VISTPAAYRDVQQELIAEIHRNTNRPVVVTVNGNISIPENIEFIERDGNYIILMADWDTNILRHIINNLTFDRNEFRRLWNSEARFVVAGTNELSISQQKKIFEFLSRPRIYNCIIVSQEIGVIDKEYSRPTKVNDVDTGMKLGVYTWFPYQSSDSCKEMNDIPLLYR